MCQIVIATFYSEYLVADVFLLWLEISGGASRQFQYTDGQRNESAFLRVCDISALITQCIADLVFTV